MNRLPLFPDTTRIEKDVLTIAGIDLSALADEYKTPLYIYDRLTMDNALVAYRDALSTYLGGYSIIYAGKAFLCLAIAEWVRQQQISLDCSSLGEIAVALAAGVPRAALVIHGVNKSSQDLEAAVAQAGVIVVDNLPELERLVEISRHSHLPELWLRLQPGQSVDTHAFTRTGYPGSKFGMGAEDLLRAVHVIRENDLPIHGLHFHLGSQFRDPAPLAPAVDMALDLAQEIGFQTGWSLSPGGGWGVAYHENDLPQPDIAKYLHFVIQMVQEGCTKRGLSLPRLHFEPGRSLVARAGVALYRVGAIKHSADQTWVLLDGGLADNPRPALYSARYTALPVRDPGRPPAGLVNLAGPYCESGDFLAQGLPMPELRQGDLVAVPVSGAYQLSMSSHYNGARGPAVLWLDENGARLIRERETPESLLSSDHGLSNLQGGGKIQA